MKAGTANMFAVSVRFIHRQNSHVPHGGRCTGRREAQSRELVKRVKILPVYARRTTSVV
jgi:hypothetical protein